MLECKFCRVQDNNKLSKIGFLGVDFYLCEECQSVVCHNCTYTSSRTGRDYCEFCVKNLHYEGKVL